MLLFVARPRTSAVGHIPDSTIYRSMDQYTNAKSVPGILILQVDAPIYFANAGYLRERYTYFIFMFLYSLKPFQEPILKMLYICGFVRISRWVDEEEDKLKSSGENSLQYVILALSGK